jgi:hypothetical protein
MDHTRSGHFEGQIRRISVEHIKAYGTGVLLASSRNGSQFGLRAESDILTKPCKYLARKG